MSKTNVAMSATNCSFTLGRRHCRQPVYDKFPEAEWCWFQMCLRQCLQCIFGFVHVGYNDVNPKLEKSRTFSVHDICRAHQI